MNEHERDNQLPRRTVAGTVSPEGREGIIARLLSAGGLCYKETNDSCERTWRASYCIERSEAQRDRGGGRGKNETEGRGRQEDATEVSSDWRRRGLLTVAHWSQITVSTTKLLAMWWMEWQPSTLRLLIPERGDKAEETEDTLGEKNGTRRRGQHNPPPTTILPTISQV